MQPGEKGNNHRAPCSLLCKMSQSQFGLVAGKKEGGGEIHREFLLDIMWNGAEDRCG